MQHSTTAETLLSVFPLSLISIDGTGRDWWGKIGTACAVRYGTVQLGLRIHPLPLPTYFGYLFFFSLAIIP